MNRIRSYSIAGLLPEADSPFDKRLDFAVLREHLILKGLDTAYSSIIQTIDQLALEPDFVDQPITLDTLIKYQDQLDTILAPFFFPLLQSNEIKAAMLPFFPHLFNATDRLLGLLDQAESPDDVTFHFGSWSDHYMNGALYVLQRVYGVNINMATSYHVSIRDAKTNIQKYYRMLINADYMQMELANERYRLSSSDIDELLDHLDDSALWKKKIPPGSYITKGFTILTLLDITREKAISLLKTDLLEPDLLYDLEHQQKVTRDLGSILKIPDLTLGFMAYESDTNSMRALGIGLWTSILMKGMTEFDEKDIFRSNYIKENGAKPQPVLLNNELVARVHLHLIKRLDDTGIKSYAAVPLVKDGTIIGVLELSSTVEGSITKLKLNEFDDILPLFVTAFKGYMEDYETQLKAIIQEKYTAIHPSVEWAFRKAAKRAWTKRSFGEKEVDSKITFDNLHPLYGQTDIRNSSLQRNEAIHKDIELQLIGAQKVLATATVRHPLPVYQMLHQQVQEHVDLLATDRGAANESSLLNFLRDRIYPAFDHLAKTDSVVAVEISAYRQALDPLSGLVTHHRTLYEQELNETNKIIITALDRGQVLAQRMFPHYFKKYKTDGVEHDMYIGSSLAPKRDFDQVYLDNLRLWQMMIICEIERGIAMRQRVATYSMEVCSLILVHSRPISILFRMDEKQFDVEGAYNLRYEIIKKRIDKATIERTGQRITQPQKLVVIYYDDSERQAYVGYINYLKSIDYLKGAIEDHILSDLQGVTGLRALRVEICLPDTLNQDHLYSDDVLQLETITN